ncbi:Phosphotransferase enzyme family protein [Aspergillus parasiticus SU-1]|uniref:Phosphotransferase enzyme family protein n=1 Tax=Aspergillus parasiticus (strain ATCC 56775 / NRRL 5862 / SRRC 143 / SU-1) TaxID=1403190 RepID=A0A0F0IIQ3_ASPPU|nr:Phosphotransferase enzyme family protein [Aspergillus parasiticus SU-1]
MVLKGLSPLHQGLSTSAGISKLGVAVMELLAILLLSQPMDIDRKINQAASCVVEFRLQQKQEALDVEGQENRQNELEGEGKGDSSTEDKESVCGQASQGVESTDRQQCTTSPEEPKLRLIYSEDIGPPTFILDPEDLKDTEDLLPDRMDACLAWADTDMLVKFGHGVHLAEAEALHLVSKRTTIAAPKLLSAYILDGTGYIIISYEHGTPFEQYWDNTSETEHQRILAQLTDYVQQMRAIEGSFIGGLDHSPCRDGVFEGGYGDHTKYSYGPYESESFNEGMVQALRDWLPAKLLESENDPQSNFWASEYILQQTVRGLKGHKIVFTHCDLHGGNMLVRYDSTVVLLDWGLSGFWPECWEFYRAIFNPPWRTPWDRMVEDLSPHTMWNTT